MLCSTNIPLTSMQVHISAREEKAKWESWVAKDYSLQAKKKLPEIQKPGGTGRSAEALKVQKSSCGFHKTHLSSLKCSDVGCLSLTY